MAQMALTIVGYGIGFMVGGPIGAAIGGTIGGLVGGMVESMLYTPETIYSHQEGPRLSDKSPPTSSYGAVIPRIWGMGRIGTTLIWDGGIAEKVVETTLTTEHEVGGGGKGFGGGSETQTSVTTLTEYYYYGTWAVLLTRGRIAGVRRIWMNGVLVYDADRFAKRETLAMSRSFAKHFTLYHGTHTQQPDPLIASDKGVSASAYRGYSYIVFSDVLLERFSNVFPVVSVEVVSEGSGTLPVYEVVVPLHRVVGDLLAEAGIPQHLYDATQLTASVRGYADLDGGTVAQKLERLAQAFLFDVVESGGRLKFIQQPAPVVRREYQIPCIISEDGLIVNSMHDELGRQGYFDSASGTSEGQFTAILACVKAWETEVDEAHRVAWKERAEFMAAALEPILYRRSVPSNPETLWVPHWLFAVRSPIQLQSWFSIQLYFNVHPTDGTRLRAYLPAGAGYYGERVKTVYQVYAHESSYLLWENPYSAVVGNSEQLLDWGTEETGWTYIDIARTSPFTWDGEHLTEPRGGVAVVAVNAGPIVSVSEGYEAWPHWRALDRGEVDCATDTLYWALDAYSRLVRMYEALGEYHKRDTWRNAYDATAWSLIETHKVEDGRDYFKPMNALSAFSQSGTFEASERDGCGPSIWSRDPATGYIVGQIPGTHHPGGGGNFGK